MSDGSGPHISLQVMQILYAVLHLLEGNRKQEFMANLMQRAVEGTSFAFSQLREMDAEVDRLRFDNERLRKLFNTPPHAWTDRDRKFIYSDKASDTLPWHEQKS